MCLALLSGHVIHGFEGVNRMISLKAKQITRRPLLYPMTCCVGHKATIVIHGVAGLVTHGADGLAMKLVSRLLIHF